MKFIKGTLKGLCIVHLLFWIGLLIWSIIEAISFTGTGKEPLETAMDQGATIVLAFACGVGAVTAGMLALSVFRFFRSERTKLRTIILCTCAANNILMYLSIYFIFFVNQDSSILFPLVWLICSAVCGVLLFADS